ncbi:MAG: tetratricopeptide repeat protein [Bacteroidales bacterium]
MVKSFFLFSLFIFLWFNSYSQIDMKAMPNRFVYNTFVKDTTKFYSWKYDNNLTRVIYIMNWIRNTENEGIDSLYTDQLNAVDEQLRNYYNNKVNFAILDKQIIQIEQKLKFYYTENLKRAKSPRYYLKQICDKNPNRARQFIASGFEDYENGKLEDAYYDFKSALGIDSINGDVYIYMAYLEDQYNFDHQRTLELLSKAIKLNNSIINAYYERARAYTGLKQYENALKDIDFYLSSYSRNINGLMLKSHILSELKYYDDAILECELAEKFIKQDTWYPQEQLGNIYNQIGWFYFLKNNYTKCVEYSNKAIEKDNKIATYYDTRGCGYYGLGEIEKSILDLTMSIKMDCKIANSYLYRGLAYCKVNKKEQACVDFIKADQLGNKEAKEMLRNNCK